MGKCKKIISQFKEDQIEDLINCKEWSEKVTNKCYTCHQPIYKTDLIYEIFISWGISWYLHIGIWKKEFSVNHVIRNGWLKWRMKKNGERKESRNYYFL